MIHDPWSTTHVDATAGGDLSGPLPCGRGEVGAGGAGLGAGKALVAPERARLALGGLILDRPGEARGTDAVCDGSLRSARQWTASDVCAHKQNTALRNQTLRSMGWSTTCTEMAFGQRHTCAGISVVANGLGESTDGQGVQSPSPASSLNRPIGHSSHTEARDSTTPV
jgi:hypothetical protein